MFASEFEKKNYTSCTYFFMRKLNLQSDFKNFHFKILVFLYFLQILTFENQAKNFENCFFLFTSWQQMDFLTIWRCTMLSSQKSLGKKWVQSTSAGVSVSRLMAKSNGRSVGTAIFTRQSATLANSHVTHLGHERDLGFRPTWKLGAR